MNGDDIAPRKTNPIPVRDDNCQVLFEKRVMGNLSPNEECKTKPILVGPGQYAAAWLRDAVVSGER